MASNYKEWYVQLYDVRLDKVIDDDTGLYTVLQAGVPLQATVYSNAYGTSLTLPGTMTNGVIQFWMDNATTSVDLSVMTASGRAFFIEAVALSDHRIYVDPYKLTYTLVGAWAVLSAHPDGTVSAVKAPQSGGLPAGIKIKDVYVHKTQLGEGVGAGMLVDFGVSGDPDGFVDGITASATGYYLNGGIFTSTTASAAGDRVSSVQTRGILLANYGAGVDTATAGGVKGLFSRTPYMISLVTTTNNLVFAITATSQLTTVAGARGYVYYEYDLLPTAGN